MKVKRKYLNDLIVYLQKTYGLYFVEFRKALNGRKIILLCHPNNKQWWIEIIILNIFEVYLIVACAGEDNCMRDTIRNDIFNKRYIGYGDKYIGKWLNL